MIRTLIHKNLIYVLSLVAVVYIALVIFVSAYQYLSIIENIYEDVVLFIVNMTFLFMVFGVIVWMIDDLFPSGQNNNDIIKPLLIFVSVLMVFSRIQEVNFTWDLKDQLFAAYFFPLLTFYLFSKSLLKKNRLAFFGAVLSAIVSVAIINSMVTLSVYNSVSDTQVIESFEFTKYFLTYLGGTFYYISGKECVSIAVIAGLFLLGTITYIGYLSFIKKLKNPLYVVILAFLFFYMALAFVTVRNELHSEIYYIFKHQYMTISLISWNLLIIFYLHLWRENEKILKNVLLLGITFSVFLMGYQFNITKDHTKLLSKKTAAFVLEMGIRDIEYIKPILDDANVYVKEAKKDNESIFVSKKINFEMVANRSKEFIKDNLSVLDYHDIKDTVFIIGTTLDNFPQKNLVGYLDNVVSVNEKKDLVRIHGWVYDMHKKNVPNKLYVVNGMNKVIGYVFTGDERTDVRHIYGKRSLFSGFIGYILDTTDVDKLFLVDIKNKNKFEVKFTTDS